MRIKMPTTFKEWTIWMITFKFVFDIAKHQFHNRGSSKESKKEFDKMKVDNDKAFNKIDKVLDKIEKKQDSFKDDMRVIFKEETKDFITKELFDERMKRQDMKVDMIVEEAKRIYEEAKIEHRNGKRRNEDIFLEVSKMFNNNKGSNEKNL